MKRRAVLSVLLLIVCGLGGPARAEETTGTEVKLLILWKQAPLQGTIEVAQGRLAGMILRAGSGRTAAPHFNLETTGPVRLELAISDAQLAPGPGATRVTVRAGEPSFSFFLRDVRADYPIYLPAYGAIVTAGAETRDYAAIEQAIRAPGRKTRLTQYEADPEENWQSAAAHTRVIHLPIWLGLSRDTRLFELETQHNQLLPESLKTDRIGARFFGEERQGFSFLLGKGVNAAETMQRRLDGGCLPILTGTRLQEEIEYSLLAFASLERSPLTMANIRGTHFLVSDYQVGGNSRDALTTAQLQLAESLQAGETSAELEQPVLYFRATARNTGTAPHYAFFLAPNPNTNLDAQRGYYMSGNNVAAIGTINGRPLPNEELSILLAPGEQAVLECRIPHQPIAAERAAVVATQDFDKRLEECRGFWRGKLAAATQINVPEREINEMLRAGLLHLDLVCFGRQPDGPIAAATGYAPIGTESAPIIQFLDSMGQHELAGRALVYFLEKQHEDGFMQNYKGYQAEVGPVLWTIGEHWRYTRDEAWARAVAPRVLKSCEYLIRRRQEGMQSPRGRGYGLIRGKVGDPEDPFQSFMLNGYACMGLARVAEMLAGIDPQQSARLAQEAAAYREDIRASFFTALADSPVVPLADGSWAPSAPPWVGEAGALILYAAPEQRHYFTHGSMLVRDCLVGPAYLPFTEVLAPEEPAARWLAEVQSELYGVRNVVPTQPYYSPHPWLQLKQGSVGSFLKAYYNTATSAFDRETYTVKEHAYGGTVHKTHEEGWFLMQTRWMLWMEEGQRLRLLAGVPRAWLKDGQRISVRNAATYYGPVSFEVESKLTAGEITAEVTCASDRKPREITVRLPHPEGKRATGVTGGEYDPQTETVRIADFIGHARIELKFE